MAKSKFSAEKPKAKAKSPKKRKGNAAAYHAAQANGSLGWRSGR